MTKPVLFAGLLGGVLGAVLGFGLSRAFPTPPPAIPLPRPSEGRQFADDLIAKLKAGKNDEFLAAVRPAFPGMNDEQYDQAVRKPLLATRAKFAEVYGRPSEFEFLRESRIAPSLVRFIYLEKCPHGCVVWNIVGYDSPEGWTVLEFRDLELQAAFNLLR